MELELLAKEYFSDLGPDRIRKDIVNLGSAGPERAKDFLQEHLNLHSNSFTFKVPKEVFSAPGISSSDIVDTIERAIVDEVERLDKVTQPLKNKLEQLWKKKEALGHDKAALEGKSGAESQLDKLKEIKAKISQLVEEITDCSLPFYLNATLILSLLEVKVKFHEEPKEKYFEVHFGLYSLKSFKVFYDHKMYG